MKITTVFIAFAFLAITGTAAAQELGGNMKMALRRDDSAALRSLVTKENLNSCFVEKEHEYSLLSQTVRANAIKCFSLLISLGADVNRSCDGYVPPLMHAAKYG